MKNILLLFLIFIFLNVAYSQENIVNVIIEYCGKIDSYISEDENDLSYYYMQKLHYISSFRAIGRQDTKITFYYPPPIDEYYEENGETKYNFWYLMPEKVKINYNIAASMDINIEYYLKDGNLLLYHSISRGAYYCIEEKYYFDGRGKLLKIETIKPPDCPQEDVLEEKPVYVKESAFNEEENKKADEIISNVGKYMDMFILLTEVEGMEK